METNTDTQRIEVENTATLESIQDMIERLAEARTNDDQDLIDEITEEIYSDPLEICLTYDPTPVGETPEATGYTILLSTGGPAYRISGNLNEWNEPCSARLERQDWFIPWGVVSVDGSLLDYAQQFYFGE